MPEKSNRFIAINDNYDTIDPNSVDNDFAGLRNWFNEFYSRDTSRKIRAVNKAKVEWGIPLTSMLPYGYLKDPDNPSYWLVDEEAAQTVRRIFALCMEGRGPSQIAKVLTKEKVLTPTAYHLSQGRKCAHKMPEVPYKWQSSSIVKMLECREYTGCTVNFKTYTNSVLDKKTRKNPAEKQSVFYGTHEAIIEQEVFDKVQELRQQRHRMTKAGRSSMFSGLVFCADCGKRLYLYTCKSFERRQDYFICSTHRMNSEKWCAFYPGRGVGGTGLGTHQVVTEAEVVDGESGKLAAKMQATMIPAPASVTEAQSSAALDVRTRLAPCGLHCGKCFAFQDGEIHDAAVRLKKYLGDFAPYAKRFETALDPVFAQYPAFAELLDYLAEASCGGCRVEKCKFYKNCAVRGCALEKQVDFCCECPEFPCEHTGLDENLYPRHVAINRKIVEIGAEAYYAEIKDTPRY